MKLSLLFFLIFTTWTMCGQNKQLLYNFDDLPQNLLSNPGAEISFDMHVGLPLLSQIHFSAGSSGVTFYDIFKVDGTSINKKIGASIEQLSDKDFFSVNQQLEILFIGWRDQKKRYYSAGIYQEMDAFLYFPKDLAVLAYQGNKDHINRTFNFNDAAFTAEVLNVFHLGMTNYYSEDFNYGARAKIYAGNLNAQSVNNRGIFRTSPSPKGQNIYRHFVNGLDAVIRTSGWASLIDSENNTTEGMAKELVERVFFGGNLGLGLDFGFTYYINERYKLTGSIVDLGFVHHKEDVENYHYFGDYQTNGIGLDFPAPDERTPGYWYIWENDLDKNLQDEVRYNSYLTWRPVKINASVDFGFLEDTEPCNCHKPTGRRRYLHHLGLHLFSIKRPRGFLHAATLSFDKKFRSDLRGKITYTVDSFSYYNIGLLFSKTMNNFNFYLAADNLLSYPNLAKAHNASVQLGFQFILNRE